jgi:hypothetical protein
MAAGLGFKDFVTGEVLTAADVDGYLMQGVWVFASAAARDAAVTSPQEGNFAYLKDTNVTTYYTGSAWANLDTTGMTNPMTTTGDIIYSSPGSTPVRRGIGTTGQVLTVSGGVPTWASASGGGANFSKLSTGTISGTSYNVTGLSGYNKLAISFQNCRNSTAYMSLSINNDTTAIYETVGFTANTTSGTAGYDANYASIGGSQFNLVGQAGSTNNLTGWVFLDGCNTSGPKLGYQIMGLTPQNTNLAINGGMVWPGTAVVSSIQFFSPNGGTNSNGTIEVYGSVN